MAKYHINRKVDKNTTVGFSTNKLSDIEGLLGLENGKTVEGNTPPYSGHSPNSPSIPGMMLRGMGVIALIILALGFLERFPLIKVEPRGQMATYSQSAKVEKNKEAKKVKVKKEKSSVTETAIVAGWLAGGKNEVFHLPDPTKGKYVWRVECLTDGSSGSVGSRQKLPCKAGEVSPWMEGSTTPFIVYPFLTAKETVMEITIKYL